MRAGGPGRLRRRGRGRRGAGDDRRPGRSPRRTRAVASPARRVATVPHRHGHRPLPLPGRPLRSCPHRGEAALEPTDATACWDAGGELSLAAAVAYARRGRGERQRPQIGWASLTPVERDVVRSVAEGHTNAEIGHRLFMSVNTVKKHLTHVYAKVDVDGRADLAAQVARRDL